MLFLKVFNVGDHRCRRQGLPSLENFAKISHNRAENRPKVGQNFRKQWIFYRAAPLNFISPYAYVGDNFDSRLSRFHIVAPLYEKHFWPFADFRMGISKSDLVLHSLLPVSESLENISVR